MAKKRAGKARPGFVVIKDAKGNIYISELGDPVTDSLTKSEKGELGDAFDAYKKSGEGRAGSAEAVIIADTKGAVRILQRGSNHSVDDDSSKKKGKK